MKNLTTVILTSNSSKGYKSTEMKQKSSITITIPSDPIVFIIAIEEAGRAVIDKINIWQAASSPEALMVIFYGVVLVLTVSIGYTVFAYRVFWGKSTQLRY